MRIKEISVNKLFGHFDYRIPLKNESIAILHGPNGCGKTTLLRLLKAVTEIDTLTLRRTPFESLKISFYDTVNLVVSRTQKDTGGTDPGKRRTYQIVFTYSKRGVPPVEPYKPETSRDISRYPTGYIEQRVPGLIRTGPDEWINRESNERFNAEELFDRYGDFIPAGANVGRISQTKVPDWLSAISDALSPHLILTQRLLRVTRSDPRYGHEIPNQMSDVVEIYSNEVKDVISRKLTESVAIAQSRDRTFPARLLQELPHIPISEIELRSKFNAIEEKRKRLITAGMLADEEAMSLLPRELAETEIKVLELYLKDVEQKLEVFDDLQMRIQTFMDIINFKLNPKGKSINVSRNNGFIFEVNYGDKNRLDAKNLSSGEQHQIVLFYELLFKTKDGALILIDEPEISLHVSWQRVFLSDLERVVKLTKQNIVMATHSPQIINNRWDLSVALDGGVRHEP